MKLIVGLGNPGKEYEKTRHNIGFLFIDNYLNSQEEKINWQNKFKALYTIIMVNNERICFLKPQTFMNLSGEAVSKFVNFYKIAIEDILVIQDDLDLQLGSYRIKTNSSSGGHNGVKSIINNLQTRDFARLKIGISNNKEIPTTDYVLGKLNKTEINKLNEIADIINNIINDFSKLSINELMSKYNRKK